MMGMVLQALTVLGKYCTTKLGPSPSLEGSSGKVAALLNHAAQLTGPCPAPHPESFLQKGELTDEVCDGVGEGLLGTVVWGGLHTNDDLVLQGVRDFVAGKQHLWVLQQLSEKHRL